jgi:hypothetical protein
MPAGTRHLMGAVGQDAADAQRAVSLDGTFWPAGCSSGHDRLIECYALDVGSAESCSVKGCPMDDLAVNTLSSPHRSSAGPKRVRKCPQGSDDS